MLLFGSDTTILNSKLASSVTCPFCHQVDGIYYTIYARYVHFFFIPTFPFGKEGELRCRNCSTKLAMTDISNALVERFERQRKEATVPKRHFAGAILLLSFVSLTLIGDRLDYLNDARYINQPKINDSYHLKTTNNNFQVLKVLRVNADSVFVIDTSRATDYQPTDKLNTEFSIERSHLKTLHQNKEIVDVKRSFWF